MEAITPSITKDEFDILLKRAGLVLSDAQSGTLYDVYGHFEAMLERLRTPPTGLRLRSAEPSHVFVPSQTLSSR